jgi:hypothetical protein
MRAISIGCANLTNLNLQGCHDINDASLTYIAARCHLLQSLNIMGIWYMIHMTWPYDRLTYLSVDLIYVYRLCGREWSCMCSDWYMTTRLFVAGRSLIMMMTMSIATGCPRLSSLWMGGTNTPMNDNAIISLASIISYHNLSVLQRNNISLSLPSMSFRCIITINTITC